MSSAALTKAKPAGDSLEALVFLLSFTAALVLLLGVFSGAADEGAAASEEDDADDITGETSELMGSAEARKREEEGERDKRRITKNERIRIK